jgi:RIO kinase 1
MHLKRILNKTLFMEEKEKLEKETTLQKFLKDEKERKIFAKVFDYRTIMALHTLAKKKLFKELEFVISTGKEAHVFRAIDSSGNFRAVKIYKVEASEFRNMERYIAGDWRFTGIKREKRELVYAWTRKEYKNLEKANKKKLNVPFPIGFKENVLVMEFIGKDGKPAKRLKETKIEKSELPEFYRQIIEFIAGLYNAELVHADLSEYNILVQEKKVFVIDIGQGVLLSHPQAKEFFERDLYNISKFFTKKGLKKSFEEIYADVKNKTKENA